METSYIELADVAYVDDYWLTRVTPTMIDIQVRFNNSDLLYQSILEQEKLVVSFIED